MSAKNRLGPSRALGFYATPAEVTNLAIDLLVGTEPVIPAHKWPRRILEPMAGTGAIVRQLIARGCPADRIVCVELDHGRAAELERATGIAPAARDVFDATNLGQFELVTTNPDFAQMARLVEHVHVCAPSLEGGYPGVLAPGGVLALLGPLNYLSPASGRRPLHERSPPDVHHLPRRPSFCAAVACAKRCGWRVTIDPEEARPRACPACLGGKVTITTSDAQDYAWFTWVRGSTNKTSRNFWLKERTER